MSDKKYYVKSESFQFRWVEFLDTPAHVETLDLCLIYNENLILARPRCFEA